MLKLFGARAAGPSDGPPSMCEAAEQRLGKLCPEHRLAVDAPTAVALIVSKLLDRIEALEQQLAELRGA